MLPRFKTSIVALVVSAEALEAGGLFVMPSNSQMPFAFDRGGSLAGVATLVAF